MNINWFRYTGIVLAVMSGAVFVVFAAIPEGNQWGISIASGVVLSIGGMMAASE